VRGGALTIFLATLGPMLTLPALRRLLMEGHGATPAGVHAFVAAGMIGSALGAPLIARRADRRADHLHLAIVLAALDALVGLATASPRLPTELLYALRPIHGLASMGLLALLFAEFRRSSAHLVAHAGGAMVAALALGPALGGALTRVGPSAPFRAAAVVSTLVAVIVASGARPRAELGASLAPPPRGTLRGSLAAPPSLAPPPSAAPLGAPPRVLLAPLCVVMTQRFAVAGLVASFAVHARAVHGLTDARIGASFSLVLVVFAAGVFALGRRWAGVMLARCMPVGAVLSGAAFVGLAVAPRGLLPVALVGAGLGCALVYAPCLDAVARTSAEGQRATPMALLHSAGAVGMILGPLAAAVLDLSLRALSAPQRCAVFLAAAGLVHAVVTFALAARCRALAAAPVPLLIPISRPIGGSAATNEENSWRREQ
jgi:MFS family permease